MSASICRFCKSPSLLPIPDSDRLWKRLRPLRYGFVHAPGIPCMGMKRRLPERSRRAGSQGRCMCRQTRTALGGLPGVFRKVSCRLPSGGSVLSAMFFTSCRIWGGKFCHSSFKVPHFLSVSCDKCRPLLNVPGEKHAPSVSISVPRFPAAAEAVKAAVNLHAWVLVVVERTDIFTSVHPHRMIRLPVK